MPKRALQGTIVRPAARQMAAAGHVVLILLAAFLGIVSTMTDLSPEAQSLIALGSVALACVFLLELTVRAFLMRNPEDKNAPWYVALGRYLTSPYGTIDAVTVLPLLKLLGGTGWMEDALLFCQLLNLLKLGRYTPGLSLVTTVFYNERRALFATMLTVLTVLVLVSAIIYMLERTAQPQTFGSIPKALWWGIATMGTVGYGDVVPMTTIGRFFAGGVMLLGVALFAVPAGILASGFASEIKKRDFVVTWHAVARVPLFATLDANRIAAIARLLKPQIVPERRVVIRRGEVANAMFFIMEGEVEVDMQPHPVRLGTGQFFGEIALISESVRTKTVTAVTDCRLLALETADFKRLITQSPEVRKAIEHIAAIRQGKNSE